MSSIDTGPRKVTRRVLVTAPPAEIFALVGDPHRHPELDGSGTLRDDRARRELGYEAHVGREQGLAELRSECSPAGAPASWPEPQRGE